MKTRHHLLVASFLADDGPDLLRKVAASRPEFSTVPERLSVHLDRVPATATWLQDALARGRSIQANWYPGDHPSPALLSARPADGKVFWQIRTEWSIPSLVEYTRSLGAWLAVFGDLFDDLRTEKLWHNRELYGFSMAGAPGWGCMFLGERGHEQLVSRRWLVHGPWLLHRFPGDVSLIQFHDLDADPATALAQALPGHRRLGDNDIGGWLRSGYTPRHEIKGLYVPDDQSLRIVCAPGREIGEREMLDACAERLVGRYNAEKPIRAVRFIFIEPADAQRHLHELWLRELEVWTFSPAGQEIRIDAEYNPAPVRPAWVDAVEASER